MIYTENIDYAQEDGQEVRPVKWLTASRWKACGRAMWLNLRNTRQVMHKAATLRTFAIGHKLEDLIVDWLKESGLKIVSQQAEVKNKWGQPLGHIDGICFDGETFRLLEIKTANAKRFKAMIKDGIPDYYMAQIQLYMRNSAQLSSKGAQLTQCMYVILNKDTSELHIEYIDYDASIAETFENMIYHVIESESVPPAYPDFTCTWCDHRTVCQGEQLAEMNCRTCANVSVVNGEFVCQFGSELCGNYIMHPELMELKGYRMVNADGEEMAIDYGDFVIAPAGKKFPGRPTFTSAEFAKNESLMKDEKFLQLCAVTGAEIC